MKIPIIFTIFLLSLSFVSASVSSDAWVIWQDWTEPTITDASSHGIDGNINANWNVCANTINNTWDSACISAGLTSWTLASSPTYIPMQDGFSVAMVYNAINCCMFPRWNGGSWAELFSYGQMYGGFNSGFTDWEHQVFRARKVFNDGNTLQVQIKTVNSNCEVTFSTPDLYSVTNHLLIVSYDASTGNTTCYKDGAICGSSLACTGQVNVSGSYPIGPAAVAVGGGTLQGGYHQFVVLNRSMTLEEMDAFYNNGSYIDVFDIALDYCGDLVCNRPGESFDNCPSDCLLSCGDTYCEGNETPISCFGDCPGTCGDTYCVGNESAFTCKEDCFGEGGSSPVFIPAQPEVPPPVIEQPVEEEKKTVFFLFENFEFEALIREISVIIRQARTYLSANPIIIIGIVGGAAALLYFGQAKPKRRKK